MSGIDTYDYYRYGNSTGDHNIFNWVPQGYVSYSTPQSKTLSISFGGVSLSETEEVYPQAYNPSLWDLWGSGNEYAAAFQNVWNGCVYYNSVGDDLLDSAEAWPAGGATTVAGIGITINHDAFC